MRWIYYIFHVFIGGYLHHLHHRSFRVEIRQYHILWHTDSHCPLYFLFLLHGKFPDLEGQEQRESLNEDMQLEYAFDVEEDTSDLSAEDAAIPESFAAGDTGAADSISYRMFHWKFTSFGTRTAIARFTSSFCSTVNFQWNIR